MPYGLIRHRVEDFEKWKGIFDKHATARRESGSKGGLLFRNADDPGELIILLQWADMKKGRTFAESEELREVMEQAGVIDKPDIYYLELIERPAK